MIDGKNKIEDDVYKWLIRSKFLCPRAKIPRANCNFNYWKPSQLTKLKHLPFSRAILVERIQGLAGYSAFRIILQHRGQKASVQVQYPCHTCISFMLDLVTYLIIMRSSLIGLKTYPEALTSSMINFVPLGSGMILLIPALCLNSWTIVQSSKKKKKSDPMSVP